MILRELRLAAVVGLSLLIVLLSGCEGGQKTLSPAPTLTPFPPDTFIGLSEAASPMEGLVETSYEAGNDQPAIRFISAIDETLLQELQLGALEAVIVHHLPAGSRYWYSPIAVDGLVFLAHEDLGEVSLTKSQLQAIFGGSIDNWAAVGGPDLPIKLYSRQPGSGAWAIAQERIMENVPLSGLAQIAPSHDFMLERVAADPGAIGYGMMGSTGDRANVLYEGYAATPETVGEQLYPLTAPVYFVSQKEPEAESRIFLAWLQSPEGQEILREKYGRVR